MHVVKIKELSRKSLIVLLTCIVLFIGVQPKKAEAFLPIALAGLSLGEALFATAAVAAAGYAAYDLSKDWVDNISYAIPVIRQQWSWMTAEAKSAWAALEAKVVDVGGAIALTADQWITAFKTGTKAILGIGATVPGYDWPGQNYEYDYNIINDRFTPEWVARYSPITFTSNSSTFALIPTLITKQGFTQNGFQPQIVFEWALKQADGTYTMNYTMPGDAISFNREILAVVVNGSKIARGGGPYAPSNGYLEADGTIVDYSRRNAIGIGFSYPTWNQALAGWDDAVTAFKLYLNAVYGGTAISSPAIPGIPTWETDKDTTKPVSIPVPPGAITYPGTGTGTLELSPEAIKTMTGEMADTANPGGPGGGGNPPKGDWPDRLKAAVTTRFPFSLPWDLYGLFALLAADPKTPVFQVDTGYMGMDVKFKYSLDFLDPYMPWFRGIVVIGFCIFLVQVTRNLLGGAK